MFTGIVRDLGRLVYIRGGVLCIDSSFSGVLSGDSIMVDGICLTVTSFSEGGRMTMDAGIETKRVTALSDRRPGDKLNLEQALRLSDRLDGHLVYGHVMEVGKVSSLRSARNTLLMDIAASALFCAKLVEKGSVAVNGVSLTVNGINRGMFSVGVIPETARRTNLGQMHAGRKVNLEADLLLAAASGRL